MPWPVGSPSAVGAVSVTFNGSPCAAATLVKTFSTTVALVSEEAEATSSPGCFPGRYAP